MTPPTAARAGTTKVSQRPWALPVVPAAVVAALLCTRFGLYWWAPPAVGVTAAGALLLRARLGHSTRRQAWFFGFCVALPGFWSTWVYFAGWSFIAVIVLVLIVIPPAVLGPGVEPTPQTALAPVLPATPFENPRSKRLRGLLDASFRLPPGAGFAVTKFEMWKRDSGYTAVVRYPQGGRVTHRKLTEVVEDLAAEMDLPNGCTIELVPGGSKAETIIKVMLVNHLEDDVPYPRTYTRRSITKPDAIGIIADGDPYEISVLRSSAVFGAARDGGKTMLLHGLVGNSAQCDDVLLWGIDLNGGGFMVPWMRPYACDEVDRPVFDFVAYDDSTAVEVAACALKVALDRKSYYAALMAQHNTDVLPISHQLPMILIIVDEGGEVGGHGASREAQRAFDMLQKIQRVARAARVNIVFTTQRGTGTYMSSDFKKGAFLKAAGPMDDDAELSFILDWQRGLSVRDLTGPGQFFFRRKPSEPPTKVKTRLLLPDQQAEIARATETWHPELDARGQAVLGAVYANRWTSRREWLRRISGAAMVDDLPDAADLEELITGTPNPQVMAAGVKSFADELREKARRALADAGITPAAATPPQSASLPAEDDLPPLPPESRAWLDELDILQEPRNTTTGVPMSSRRERVDLTQGQMFIYERIQAAGLDGLRTGDLYDMATAEGLTDRRATVSEWIGQLREMGLVRAHPQTYASWVAVD